MDYNCCTCQCLNISWNSGYSSVLWWFVIGFTSMKTKANIFCCLGAAPSSLSPGPLLIQFTEASFFKASNLSEDKVKKLVLPFHHVGPRDHKQLERTFTWWTILLAWESVVYILIYNRFCFFSMFTYSLLGGVTIINLFCCWYKQAYPQA